MEPLKARLRDVIRQASASRLKIHAEAPHVDVLEPDPGFRPGRILASHMVFILIAGDPLRAVFKVHFDAAKSRRLAHRVFGGDSPEAITEGQVIDYFKEYGNLVAGNVVALMQEARVDLGISLPLCTRGFYEVFADYSEANQAAAGGTDFWRLEAGDHQIGCSSAFEILDSAGLGGLAELDIATVADEGGEMDFL